MGMNLVRICMSPGSPVSQTNGVAITGSARQDKIQIREGQPRQEPEDQYRREDLGTNLGKTYFPEFADSCTRTTKGCLRVKIMDCCLRNIGGDTISWGSRLPSPPTMAESSFLAFVGD